jgi:hypothetical protein
MAFGTGRMINSFVVGTEGGAIYKSSLSFTKRVGTTGTVSRVITIVFGTTGTVSRVITIVFGTTGTADGAAGCTVACRPLLT